MIDLIVAHDENRAIAKDGVIPWYIPDDLKWFKSLTVGKTVVMGRKTYEHIGKPLPDRMNIVITNKVERLHPRIIQVDNISFIIDYAKDNHVFIIGGAELYSQFINHCKNLYITEIKKNKDGDTFFPPIPENFRLASIWSKQHISENDIIDYDIKVYIR
jgi:dihydrofolate reductase